MSDEGLAALHKEAQTHTGHAYIRPKDASTLLILDRSGSALRVLMGKRHQRHTFMPGKFVFPGGRVDPGDSRVAVSSSYHPEVERKLAVLPKGGKLTPSRLKALAVAAVRETYEEAGLFIGRQTGRQWPAKGDFQAFSDRGIELDLSPVRMIARAITPPGRPRRFDTRFLAVFADGIADRLPQGTGPSGELEDIAWLTLEETRDADLPIITQKILSDLAERLAHDPDLAPQTPVPLYFARGNGFARELI